MALNIAQLRTFVEVVERGSLSGAARGLGLSQPAVTMQVQGLESELGATLLERRYRKVELTEAGRVFLPAARSMLAKLDAARDGIARLADTVGGHLVVAVSTTPGQYVVPRLLGAFLRRYPDVSVSLRVHDTAEVVAAVEAGEAQLGMTGAELSQAKVAFEQMGVDRLVIVCPPDSPVATGADVTLAELAEQPFIMREPGSGTRMATERVLREGGIEPADLDVVLELGTNEAIVNAVEGGLGVGVVSHWAADKALRLATIAAVRTPAFPVDRPLFAVLPRGEMSRAAAALLDHLRDELAV